jgi:glycolate oxidase FAD binding subunit
VDVLFEGTEAGLAAQVKVVKSIMGAAAVGDGGGEVWGAREETCSAGKSGAEFAVAKFATLPAEIVETIEAIARLSAELRWKVVVQATGIGWMRLEGLDDLIDSVLEEFRADLEDDGGSVVITHGSIEMGESDAWGKAGDALALMRAVKGQFDFAGTLNPGRFLGGI